MARCFVAESAGKGARSPIAVTAGLYPWIVLRSKDDSHGESSSSNELKSTVWTPLGETH